ncbi:DUF6177 family protein [Streptomyces sp. NPDC048304]|uniref:DUF6177 family protein n=1 Tax=Streptomyces sp. NPDC048304 TaxID=3154820 RepID=UPI0033D9E8BB
MRTAGFDAIPLGTSTAPALHYPLGGRTDAAAWQALESLTTHLGAGTPRGAHPAGDSAGIRPLLRGWGRLRLVSFRVSRVLLSQGRQPRP